jgi:alpha-D-xyloside xylohydrolase
MMRPLFLEFPSDPAVWHLDTQYMLGSKLLVAPIFNNEGDVTYYVPKGKWYGLLDGKFREGPGYVTESHDFFSMPVLLRPGTAIVVGKGGENPTYDWTDGIKLVVNMVDDLDITVEIPDYEKQGKMKATISLKSSSDGLYYSVKGSLASTWSIVISGRDIAGSSSGEMKIENREGELHYASS